MVNRICILLTACVNPNGMCYTALNDVEERRRQYYIALDFYLRVTNVPVVFIENTNCDIGKDYKTYIEAGRLECFTFNGNDFDKSLGKGYGEALIINEAFRRSSFLNRYRYVVKITGRLIVRNINHILSSRILCFDNIFRCDLRPNDFLWSMVFVIKASTLNRIFRENINQINDSEWKLFEHVLYRAMYEDKKTIAVPFIQSPIIEGISGSLNEPYADILGDDRCNTNMQLIPFFYKKANRHFFYIISRIARFIYNKLIKQNQ